MQIDKRIAELAERSRQRRTYAYTDFLNEQTQTIIKNSFPDDFVKFYGGADFAERKIARFGEEGDYGGDFPLKIIRITLSGGKFATPVTHRDVLGAIMSCGIERDKVGDIFAGDEIYAVVYETVCAHLTRELTKIGRNNVEVNVVDKINDKIKPATEQIQVSAQSNRLDAIVTRLYNLSREKSAELAEQGKLAVNGVPCDKGARALKTGETVSVRGYGKFRFEGENGQSRKGKTYFTLTVFK